MENTANKLNTIMISILKLTIEYNSEIMAMTTVHATNMNSYKLDHQKRVVKHLNEIKKDYNKKHDELLNELNKLVSAQVE